MFVDCATTALTQLSAGTYVDSFHRAADSSLLPAELSGYIKLGSVRHELLRRFSKLQLSSRILCRDVLLEVNGEDVSQLPLSEIPRVLGAAKRPVTLKFERAAMSLSYVDIVRDPRKVRLVSIMHCYVPPYINNCHGFHYQLPWFMQYIVESSGVEAAITDQVGDRLTDLGRALNDGSYLPQLGKDLLVA